MVGILLYYYYTHNDDCYATYCWMMTATHCYTIAYYCLTCRIPSTRQHPTFPRRFLWGTYRPHVYYYEVWECIRKLLLTGLLVYFEEGTATQVGTNRV